MVLQNPCKPLIDNGPNCISFGAKVLGTLVDDPSLNQRVLGSSPSAPTIVSLEQFGVTEVERRGRFTPGFTHLFPVSAGLSLHG
jgi:hypothetical protein